MLCSVASPADSINLEGITSQFQNLICRLKTVPTTMSEQVTEYIRNHRYIQYDLKKGIPSAIELQDYYLSDPRLPAHVGALTGRQRQVDYLHMEYVEIPTWAISLRFIREGGYTLTDRGKLLPILSARAADGALGESESEANPFIISDGEKFLFLYSILETDGDVLKDLYRELSLVKNEVTVDMVRESMLTVLKNLSSELFSRRGRVSPSTESDTISNMIKTLERGSVQIVIPRIEPLVDCGIIARTSRKQYTYKMAPNTSPFFELLNAVSDINYFLEERLAKATLALLNIQPTLSSASIRHYIVDGYQRMRSGLGYCSIRELSILAVSTAINEHADCFEIGEVERELVSLSKEYGSGVRFTKNRQGKIALVRIDRRLAESLNEQTY